MQQRGHPGSSPFFLACPPLPPPPQLLLRKCPDVVDLICVFEFSGGAVAGFTVYGSAARERSRGAGQSCAPGFYSRGITGAGGSGARDERRGCLGCAVRRIAARGDL